MGRGVLSGRAFGTRCAFSCFVQKTRETWAHLPAVGFPQAQGAALLSHSTLLSRLISETRHDALHCPGWNLAERFLLQTGDNSTRPTRLGRTSRAGGWGCPAQSLALIAAAQIPPVGAKPCAERISPSTSCPPVSSAGLVLKVPFHAEQSSFICSFRIALPWLNK